VGVGVGVVLVVLVAASLFGVARLLTDGRFRGTHRVRGVADGPGPGAAEAPGPLTGTDLEHALGERATLLQFSSAFCAPCRATRRVLADVAAVVPGVEHVEVDAEHHLDLVRRVDVLRTPTTLVLDKDGREVSRASGALRKEQVLVALAAAVEDGADGPGSPDAPDGPDAPGAS
jgi:thiol-disulfide isomerase/thioredoxin